MSKLSIQSEMRAVDQKDRDFYDSLTDDERRKFSLYLMLRYSANVEGIPELEHYYLAAHNQRVNKNFFSLSKHPKLQWLLITTISPGMGNHKHYWLKPRSQDSRRSRINRFIESQNPDLNDQELELLTRLTTAEELIEMAKNLGMSDEQIKREL